MAEFHTYPPITERVAAKPPRPASRSICLVCLSRVCAHLDAPVRVLSNRKLELIRILTGGIANKEIAARMGLSEGTVKVYLSRIFTALGLTSRWELMLWGLKHADLIAPPTVHPETAPDRESVTLKYLGKYPVVAV